MILRVFGILNCLWGFISGLALTSGIWIFILHGSKKFIPKITSSFFALGIYVTFPFSIVSKKFSYSILFWYLIPLVFLAGGIGVFFSQRWARLLLLISIFTSIIVWAINLVSNNVANKWGTVFPLLFLVVTFYILARNK